MVVVQPDERNMYDQHWLSSVLREKYPLFNQLKDFLILMFVTVKKLCCFFFLNFKTRTIL